MVKGVEGLRVADGSVMPDLVAVNPCITTMVIGEKCADLLREDARTVQGRGNCVTGQGRGGSSPCRAATGRSAPRACTSGSP